MKNKLDELTHFIMKNQLSAEQGECLMPNVTDVLNEIKRLNSLPNDEYWKQRCQLVEFIEEVNPCDPDINQEQIDAWNKYRVFLKEKGIRG